MPAAGPCAPVAPGAIDRGQRRRQRINRTAPVVLPVALAAETRDHVSTALGVAFDIHKCQIVGVFQQMRKAAIAVITLVERRLFPLHRVFDHRRVNHFMILAPQGMACLDQQAVQLALLFRQIGRQIRVQISRKLLFVLLLTLQVFVIDEFIAVVA